MTADELRVLVEQGDARAVRRALKGMSEAQRRALAPTAARLRKTYWPFRIWRDETPEAVARRERAIELSDACSVAFVATATGSELARTVLGMSEAFDVLAERKPPWLNDWAAKAVEKDIRFWSLAHDLVTAGLSARPTSDNWCLGFLAHAGAGGFLGLRRDIAGPEVHLRDPAFVKRELWRLFEIEGTRDFSLANIDRWARKGNWSEAICSAARAGKLPRARLLDASLGALSRDFIQYRAGWFARLHETLQPTLAERAARVDQYLGLLSSRVPPTVVLALDALATLQAAGRLPAKALLAHVAPALQARAKKTALRVLTLVDASVTKEPAVAGRAVLVASTALAHEAAEVQARALALIAAHGQRSDRTLAARVVELAPGVTATLRPKLAAWLGDDAPTPRRTEDPARTTPRPNPDAAAPLARAGSLDESIELLAGAIERFEDPDEIEGALAGVARFCGERPPDFAERIGALAKRATRMLEKNTFYRFHSDPRGDLCVVAKSWAAPCALEPRPGHRDINTFLCGRIREVAVRAGERRPTTLLGTPTHRDGWIDPQVLVARARQVAPDPLDAVQSLLRIARDGRSQALARAADVSGEYGAALRFALGGAREQGPSTPESDLWLAAETSRDNDYPADRFGLLKYGLQLYVGDGPGFVRLESLRLRWAATVMPCDLQTLFRAGGSAILAYVNRRHALWWNPVFLEPLFRPDVPMEKNARRLVAIALASSQAAEAGIAADVLIRIVSDGRAEAEAMGDTFAMLLAAEVVTGGEGYGSYIDVLRANKLPDGPMSCARWAKRLREVARSSARHAAFARDVIARALRGLPEPPHRDVGALLELLRELCAETGVPVRDAETRAKLTSLKVGGNAGAHARALVAEGAT